MSQGGQAVCARGTLRTLPQCFPQSTPENIARWPTRVCVHAASWPPSAANLSPPPLFESPVTLFSPLHPRTSAPLHPLPAPLPLKSPSPLSEQPPGSSVARHGFGFPCHLETAPFSEVGHVVQQSNRSIHHHHRPRRRGRLPRRRPRSTQRSRRPDPRQDQRRDRQAHRRPHRPPQPAAKP